MHGMSKSINVSVEDAAVICNVLRQMGDSDLSVLRVGFGA